MRERIQPEDYRGKYFDEIRPEDLIIMGETPDDIAGLIHTERGICESLWRLSVETDLGLIVDIRRVPLKQAFIDECNRKEVNPYEQPMDQRIYVVHPLSKYHLNRELTVIGYLTKQKVCKVINGDRESFLNK